MPASQLIPANWQLPEVLRLRLGSSVGRQRTMYEDGHLLIVAHRVPSADQTDRQGVLFWRNAAGQWAASNGDPGGVAIENLLRQYEKTLEKFDQMEHKAQRADEYLELLEGLAPVSRAIRNFWEVLEEARKALPSARELIDIRDRAYDLSRNSELLYQDSKNAMDVAVVRRAEEQALASYQTAEEARRLNRMAALFFPLATIGTIFGTTLTENWSWSQTTGPFFLFLIFGMACGIALSLFINRPVAQKS